jgi:hypothetical protein
MPWAQSCPNAQFKSARHVCIVAKRPGFRGLPPIGPAQRRHQAGAHGTDDARTVHCCGMVDGEPEVA